MNTSDIPTIFLAFANDRNDKTRYLRQLDQEARHLRSVLEAGSNSLARLIVRQDATIDEILNVFQQSDNRGKINIFHFAGHANGFQILLESSKGEAVAADASGLASFLAHQDGLSLVFLNGCSTQQQVQGLLDAGIPMVIATSQAIDDTLATQFAHSFYSLLLEGADIRTAFDGATTKLTGQNATGLQSSFRTLRTEPEGEHRILLPWGLHVRDGSEQSGKWNLPEASGKPLTGLPPLPPNPLPDSPFRHLNWFTAAHAAVYFGRGLEIRRLFNLVTSSAAAPVVLLYGQSGVGKSSLLDAGLLPRLDQVHTTLYLRRQDQSLLDTLRTGVEISEPATEIGEAWRSIERNTGRPLSIILDQVEQAFTDRAELFPGELADFWRELRQIFTSPTAQPLGKLILGFRKEWLSPVEERLKEELVPYDTFFLEPLGRRGIVEAVCGTADTRSLRDFYGLSVEEGLPEVIADDLLEDSDSAVAPTLQILLTKLWEQGTSTDEGGVSFTHNLYQELRRQGLLLSDFVNQQLRVLADRLPEASASGLVLDFLDFHITPTVTSKRCSESELRQAYRHQLDTVTLLMHECQELYLLTRSDGDRGGSEPFTHLAHDALAVCIRALYDESDRPGQRAHRLLTTHLRTAQNQRNLLIGPKILRLVEQGRDGMRVLSPTAETILAESRVALEKFKPRPLTRTLFPPNLNVKDFEPDVRLIVGYRNVSEIMFDLKEQITKAENAPIKDAVRMRIEPEGASVVGILQYGTFDFYRTPPQENEHRVLETLAPFYLSLNNALGHVNMDHRIIEEAL